MILVINVVDMCKSRGFCLMGFISGNRELLMLIPEDQRRNGIKNADLIADLPTEKALINGILLRTLLLSTFR